MRRVALAAFVVAAVVAAPAAGDVYNRKHSVDARLSALQARIAAAQERAQQLSAEIDSVSSRIQALAGRVGDVSARLVTLESDLALHRRKLDRLTTLFGIETQRYVFLRREYSLALARVNARLVEVYEQGDVDSVDVILAEVAHGRVVGELHGGSFVVYATIARKKHAPSVPRV